MSTNRTATLTIDGKTVEFPVMVGTHSPFANLKSLISSKPDK